VHQELVTFSARDLEYFSIDSRHFLVVANDPLITHGTLHLVQEAILAAGSKVARGYMFYRRFFFFFLGNRPTCDQTADRRREKSIPLLRTYMYV